MQNHYYTKKQFLVLLLTVITVFSACKKHDEIYRPGIPKGTRFQVLTVEGFVLDSVQVRIGPRSIVAGYLFEEVSSNTFEVPFDTALNVNRVVLYQKDGSLPYPGSQFRFEDRYRDTSVTVFYDGKTISYNPVLPKPANGKMGMRITFKSTASKYTGPVDIEFHEAYQRTFKRPMLDSAGNPVLDKNGDPKTESYDSTLVKPEITFTIKNVKRSEFNDFFELTVPADSRQVGYAMYIRLPGTTNPLNYQKGLDITPYEVISFNEDYTKLITIIDARLVTTRPNRIIYEVADRSGTFQQAP
ncbi:MAG: hypothetical protein EOP51_18590 [Sphingobacteriales bacterium]|nr:MAG: hypothetical protein EOP51_18590 [Sphingobacteriales bacterium]